IGGVPKDKTLQVSTQNVYRRHSEGQNSPNEQANVYRKGSEGQNSPNEQPKCLSEGFRRTKLSK
ncbi:hypothetical protein, partial [Bacillus sp. UNC41MFS5]|uniref:hypothetical protein n=1 Tax=Bacillus sp. UNC41MFS5 TaxID=1449046 RepID=UPI0005592103